MAQIDDVSDHGLEVLKKAAVIPDSNYKTRYSLRTKDDRLTFAGVSLNVKDTSQAYDNSGNLKVIDERLVINDTGQLKVVLDGTVCETNSSSIPLLAGATFTGVASDTLDYAIIFVTAYSNVASATNGLKLQTSSDGITWRDSDVYSVAAGVEKTFSFQANKKFFRVVYVNGASNQTTFDLHTIKKKAYGKPSSHRIQDDIVNDDDAELVKAVITGKKPNGAFTNFQSTASGNFKVSLEELENGVSVNGNSQLKTTSFDSTGEEIFTTANPANVKLPQITYDSFGRSRVSNPYPIFNSLFSVDKDTDKWGEVLTAGGTSTLNVAKACVEMAVTTASGDKVVRQTRRSFFYVTGMSKIHYQSFVFAPAKTNLRQRIGAFDDDNGVFLEQAGTTKKLVVRSNTSGTPVDNAIPQSSWNSDKLDGTGASGVTLDLSKAQILFIDAQWLGVGKVRVGFVVDGGVIIAHEFMHANSLTEVYARTAKWHLRTEIENTDVTASASTMQHICSSVLIEGDTTTIYGRSRTANNGLTTRTLSAATQRPVLSIRPTITNSTILPISLEVMVTTSTDALIEIYLNSVVNGGAWVANSLVGEKNITGTSITGGSLLQSHYNSGGNQSPPVKVEFDQEIFLGHTLAGVADTYTICVTSISGIGQAVAAINYKEIY